MDRFWLYVTWFLIAAVVLYLANICRRLRHDLSNVDSLASNHDYRLRSLEEYVNHRQGRVAGDTITIQGKPAWIFCCEWYSVDEIKEALERKSRTPEESAIPFPEWLTHQYRLAMHKGMQLARDGEPQ